MLKGLVYSTGGIIASCIIYPDKILNPVISYKTQCTITQLYYYLDCFAMSCCMLFTLFDKFSQTYNGILIIRCVCHIMLYLIFTFHIHVFNIKDFV